MYLNSMVGLAKAYQFSRPKQTYAYEADADMSNGSGWSTWTYDLLLLGYRPTQLAVSKGPSRGFYPWLYYRCSLSPRSISQPYTFRLPHPPLFFSASCTLHSAKTDGYGVAACEFLWAYCAVMCHLSTLQHPSIWP